MEIYIPTWGRFSRTDFTAGNPRVMVSVTSADWYSCIRAISHFA